MSYPILCEFRTPKQRATRPFSIVLRKREHAALPYVVHRRDDDNGVTFEGGAYFETWAQAYSDWQRKVRDHLTAYPADVFEEYDPDTACKPLVLGFDAMPASWNEAKREAICEAIGDELGDMSYKDRIRSEVADWDTAAWQDYADQMEQLDEEDEE